MPRHPDTLRDICISVIEAHTLSLLQHGYRVTTTEDDDDDVLLPSTVAEELLFKFSEHGHLNDEVLRTVFSARRVILRQARMPNSAMITEKGFLTLWHHQIKCLEAIGAIRIPLDDLIGCLGRWTLQNLHHLNVSGCKHIWHPFKLTKQKLSIKRLMNLRSLDVSHTKLDNKGLYIVADNVPGLQHLNISCTRVTDISPLLLRSSTLISLHMFNLKECDDDISMEVLPRLGAITRLDLSVETPDASRRFVSPTRFRINNLLVQEDHACLPNLVLLDISGRRDIVVEDLRAFLERHPRLQFLGLMQTETCADPMFIDECRKGLKVTGNCSTTQAKTALVHYILDRPQFVQESLSFLFERSLRQPGCNVELISLILPGIELHQKKVTLLVMATGFVRNILRDKIADVSPNLLGKLVDGVLVAMENYPTHKQLQENVLNILCNNGVYVPQVIFDYKKCARLAMDCFKHFDYAEFCQMSLYVCFCTSRTMLTKGAQNCIQIRRDEITKMMDIYRRKLQERVVDDAMTEILKSVANLTCNSAENGQMLLQVGGIELLVQTFEVFPERKYLLNCCCMITHSIALFKHLRPLLCKDNLLEAFRHHLWNDDYSISLHICGVMALLSMNEDEPWHATCMSRDEVLDTVYKRLRCLKPPQTLSYQLRSFTPGYPMLSCQIPYQAQMWIITCIHHLCSIQPERYCHMLVSENGLGLLLKLLGDEKTHPEIRKYCRDICEIVRLHGYMPPVPDTPL